MVKKSVSRSRSKKRSSPSKSLSSSNLLTSSSLALSSPKREDKVPGSGGRKVACKVKENGKVECATFDKPEMNLSERGRKIMAHKMKECQKAQDYGLGTCDAEGNFWGFQDDIPNSFNEEIDENGNIIRSMIIDPAYIRIEPNDKAREAWKELTNSIKEAVNVLESASSVTTPERLNKALQNYKALTEHKLVNPDKLKASYMTTKDDIKHRNRLIRYLVGIASGNSEGDLGGLGELGNTFLGFQKNLLKYQLLTDVLAMFGDQSIIDKVKTRVKNGGGLGSITRSVSLGASGMSIDLDDDFMFSSVKWEYAEDKEIRVKLPEAMAADISEKLSTLRLQKIINKYKAGQQVDTDDVVAWIKSLINNGTLVPSEMSNTVLIILITKLELTAADLGMTDEQYIRILKEETNPRTVVFNSVADATINGLDENRRNLAAKFFTTAKPRPPPESTPPTTT